MSLEESRLFRKHHSENVLPSRFVERWKATDDGGTKPKSRLVILGFKDPHVLQLERSAPTPTQEAFTATLQVFASLRRTATSSDIKNAFGQSRRTTRKDKVAAQLPPGFIEAMKQKIHPEQLLMCETEVYGLISGPSWLRQSLVADFEEWGYVRNPYDRCVMTLKHPKDQNITSGTVLIEVDDLLEGGDEHHHARMRQFYQK